MLGRNDKVPLVYILGTSFSGSTLLGFVLGSSRQIFNLGEVKIIEKFRHQRDCSCGKGIRDCPFWTVFDFDATAAAPRVSFWQKLSAFASALIGNTDIRPRPDNVDRFLAEALVSARALDPDHRYLLDVSKSLWRLIYLMRCSNIDLKVVYLERDAHGAVASFVKRGDGFWRSLLIHAVNNFLIKRFLKRHRVDHIHVDYARFCAQPERSLETIGTYLSVDFGDYAAGVRQRDFHILTGNAGTRTSVLRDFQGVAYDDSWKQRLTGFQKFVLDGVNGGRDVRPAPAEGVSRS